MTNSTKFKSGLIIGDAHAKPGVSNRRFEWLGNAIMDMRPDFIVDMGDWEDMESLCSYDKGKKSFEGRRLKDDFKASVDASEKAFGPIKKYNNTRSKNKKKKYNPEIYRIGGNHTEGRINRMLESSPEFIGTYGMENFEYGRWGDTYVPFLQPLIYNNIAISHFFYRKDSRYSPMSAKAMLNITNMSAIQGHNHCIDFDFKVRADKKKVFGMFAGCYLDPDDFGAEYAGPQVGWWSGLIRIHGVDGTGYFEPEFIGIDRVKRLYG